MKSIFKMTGLCGMAFAFAATASAQTYVYITGATAYRACVHQAICEILDPGFTFAGDNNNPYQQNIAVYSGKLNQRNPTTDPAVVIKTFWTTSLAGLYDLSKPRNVPFAADSYLTTCGAASTGFGAQGQTTFGAFPSFIPISGYATDSQPPTVCLSDIFQTTGVAVFANGGFPAAGTLSGASLTAAGTAGKAGGAEIIGLVPFQWVLGITSATQPAVTNITQEQALALVGGGEIPVMFLTHNLADKNKYFLQVGRNEGTGSRVNAHAEAQNGYGSSAVQFALGFGSNNTTQTDGLQTGGSGSTVASFDVWPASAPLTAWDTSINWLTPGHSGYFTGNDLRNALISSNPSLLASTSGHSSGGALTDTSGNVPAAATNVYFIGYLGTADAAIGGNAVQLKYSGVPFSQSNVENGNYSLWGYEHMSYISTLGGVAKTVCDTIADQIFTTDADINNNNGVGGISVHGSSGAVLQSGVLANTSVLVTRAVEGTVITQNY